MKTWKVTNGDEVLRTFLTKREAQLFLWRSKVVRIGLQCSGGAMMDHLDKQNPEWRNLGSREISRIIAECRETVPASMEGYQVIKGA